MALEGPACTPGETADMDSGPGWLAGPNNLEELVVVLLALLALAAPIAARAMRGRRIVAVALLLATTVLSGVIVGARAYSGAKHVHNCHTNNNDGCPGAYRHDEDGHTHWLLS